MIHLLAPGMSDAGFDILDVVAPGDFRHAAHLFTFTAASWSMFPTIRKGDVLTIEEADRIEAGDVVVFPFMDTLVCHRVKRIGADGRIHTQGDAANRPDAPIQRQDILGKVTEIIRGHDRLVPAPVPRPSPAGLVRMKIDFFQMRLRERLLEWGSKSLAFLKRRAPLKIMAALALKRYARFYLGVRAPLQSMQAYRFLPLPRTDHDGRLDGPLPPEFDGASDVLIQARLGRHRLGTWHPASGTMRIRQAAAGLGLEDSLRAALPAP
jgi:hypothetical protein